MMKTDAELQTDVQNAIHWEPLLNEAEIGVIARDGVVSLNGQVDSYAKKIVAENAAKKVLGVKALVENIEVNLPSKWMLTDSEIASSALAALKTSWSIPKDRITVKVENGWITLEGYLPWHYQREIAKSAINYLSGVKGVINHIKIRSESSDTIKKVDVENALRRSAIDDSNIEVSVKDTTVTLSGTSNSWYEKDEAERIAWNTPGVWHMKNDLEVDYKLSLQH
ncbi:BON domain-containing protein [Sphingobacterium bovisgrunnientis]|jgi:osmotically-inducible protein OsmY|uniref:BON domain-containing protein n=1 Tax=Sphingobacterium bovisgrunnientis TaxID=1874697 RepID=UPI001F03E386|nr:BON domain-containing protein [Sphingobacterium bovisgrunnientis]